MFIFKRLVQNFVVQAFLVNIFYSEVIKSLPDVFFAVYSYYYLNYFQSTNFLLNDLQTTRNEEDI